MFTTFLCLIAAAVPWTQFHGPNGQGDAANTKLPLTWSEKENVVWKTPIPGRGWSSPVVFDNQIWMTTATDEGRSLRAIGVALDNGKLLHDVEVFHRDKPLTIQARNSHASPTPVIEQGRVYVNFGTTGTACLDTGAGKILWRSDALQLDHAVGPGSSPILYRDLFIVNCDGTNTQYIAALDKQTGNLAWKTKRSGKLSNNPDVCKAYTTCAIAAIAGRDQLISLGADWLYAYEPLTGKELWRTGFKGFSNVCVPIIGDNLIYISTGFGRAQLWAVRPTDATVAWKYEKPSPNIPTPVLVGDNLFVLTDSGIGICLDAKTGKENWREILRGAHVASPIHADGKIYFTSEKGKTTVVAADRAFKVLATNQIDDEVMATPAVAGNALILRGKTALYRIQQR
jgi:outer membrane protein assembly factor BamB